MIHVVAAAAAAAGEEEQRAVMVSSSSKMALRQNKIGFHDPHQFITYCLHTLYCASQLDKTKDFGQAAQEWKGMISDKISEALQQEDPKLATNAEFETQQMVPKPLLHWACHFGLTLELIQTICQLHPSAIQTEKRGIFPIEEALQNDDTSIETIIFLLETAEYPEPTIPTFMKLLMTKFGLSDALPLFEQFMPDKKAQRDLTKSIQFEWGYDHDIAADLLSHLAKLHQQSEFTWVAHADIANVLLFQVDDESKISVVVGSEYEIPRVIHRLLRIPELSLTAIESPHISHCCWINDFCTIISSRQNTPTIETNYYHPSRAAFAYVRRLTIRFQTITSETMDRLIWSIHTAMPNLQSLALRNAWHGSLTEPQGYSKLPLFADSRLEELEVAGDPFAFSSILQLLELSTSLRKLQVVHEQASFIIDTQQSIDLAIAIPQSGEKNAKPDNGSGADATSLEELHIDYLFEDASLFEVKMAESLRTNTKLKVLRLPQLDSNHSILDKKKNVTLPSTSPSSSLVDLVRLQQNTTLEMVVVGSTEESDELQYWCCRNQLMPRLHEETLRLQDAIAIATPYLLDDSSSKNRNDDSQSATRRGSSILSGVKRPRGLEDRFCHSLAYEMVRGRPDLWKPELTSSLQLDKS